MIRRWFLLGLLCLAVFALFKNMYKEAIMYNPMDGIQADSRATIKDGDHASPVFEAAWSKEIIDNNLFNPTRTPFQPQLPPHVKSQADIKAVELPKRPDLQLKGVVLDQSEDLIAYIEKDRAKAVPVRKGDKLDDVEVIDVQQKSVELKWNEEIISLTLERIKTIKKPR